VHKIEMAEQGNILNAFKDALKCGHSRIYFTSLIPHPHFHSISGLQSCRL